jgi:hypothetical protein
VSGTRAFNPYALLRELERHQVAYVLIGGLARVLHGTGEVTRGVDITPAVRPSNVRRLQNALQGLEATVAADRQPAPDALMSAPATTLTTRHGELKVVPEPAGTTGYADLRRRAARQPIGQGLRPAVAAPGELVRMLEAFGRDSDLPKRHALHRVIELDRGRGLEM